MIIRRRRSAFTLLEVLVVLGILAMFMALLVPFFFRMREGGRSAACVRNMQFIGRAIQAYATEHNDSLPGPLSTEQHPVQSAGVPPRDNQMLKYIGSYLDKMGEGASAKESFTNPGWERAEHTTDSPIFLLNTDTLPPYDQSPWGSADKPPLKLSQLKGFKVLVGDRLEPMAAEDMWALTEADQPLGSILGLNNEKWFGRMPGKAVHVSHRNALYFDWHVEQLVLHKSKVTPATE